MYRAIPVLVLCAACAGAKGLVPEDYLEIVAFQNALRREIARPATDLFVEAMLFELPADIELDGIDVQGATGSGSRTLDEGWDTLIVCFDRLAPEAERFHYVPWNSSIDLPRATDADFARYSGENDAGQFFAAAGRALTGFDRFHRIAIVDAARGSVFVAEKGGKQILAVGDDVREGDFFDSDFPPVLSPDGRHIAFALPGLFGAKGAVADTGHVERAERLVHPGVIDWPILLYGEGGTWAATGVDGDGRFAIDAGVVLGHFESVSGPYRIGPADRVVFFVRDGGKQRYLIGAQSTPEFDSVSGLQIDAAGRWACLGRDADGAHVVIDGAEVFRCAAMPRFGTNGSAWVGAIRESDGLWVVHGDRRFGPFDDVASLLLSEDGSAVAFAIGEGGRPDWYVDGERIGADFEQVSDVQLLAGGGYAFEGRNTAGAFLVTRGGRSGPWDGLGTRRVSADGSEIAFGAVRGREVWRKVLPLR